ncbi:sortase [Candidatus Saccharibacteria bacterium]|nr:sortase [Candidatus Saccharibacteria bacterium]
MKKILVLKLATLWIFIGLFVTSFYLLRPNQVAMSTTIASMPAQSFETSLEEVLISGDPSRITIPNLGVDKQVLPGIFDINSQTWSLSGSNAHYATVTSQPNNKAGNTFIYGHNNMQVFGKLLDAPLGTEALVTTSNSHVFRYVLRQITDVPPTDTTYLGPSTSPILTIQTCSGLWSENRRMFVFDLVEAT